MSKAYQEHKNLNFSELASETLNFWKTNQTFEKSISTREGSPTFTFFEGPPSANGTPGIHHVMARTIKDIFCRYKTLQGFQVKRKGGWDTHGLPVELQVEKELGITKEDIGKSISVEDYNKKCRETVMRFTSQWDELTIKMGYWVDLKNPYITYENNYIESLWHILKNFHSKGLLYKGHTIQPYSPAAGTGLSSHELNQPGCYQDVKDTSVVAQFRVKSSSNLQGFKNLGGLENLFFLAWTTTPWTLPSNSALAVGEKITYVLVKSFNPYTFEPINVILAKDLLGKYFSEKAKEVAIADYKAGDKLIPFEVLAEFAGKDLVGIEYEQLLPYVQPSAPAFRVIAGDFVTTSDGTGIVHIAPTFGADDARVAKVAGIPGIFVKDENGAEVPLVNKQGRFVLEVTDFANEPVKEAYLSDEEKEAERAKQGRDKYLGVDERISIKLKTENKAFKVEKYEHSYPHCWRTDKPILYYPMESWFIKTTAVKDRLVELNKNINWKPESTGTGRFGNWLENLVDWNLSRSRYWGTPLPIWRTEDGTEEICIGSQEELATEIEKANSVLGKSQPTRLEDLHRPYVDNVILVSSTGKPMTRETDLIDVWFDSGAMPYAQWHYPFENKELIENRTSYPADFISEGVDQTRGWFFTLHAISGMLFDDVAFKNVISTGLVLDKNGEKMSKRKGNVINPFETLDKYGPDATRWYMVSNANPWDNLKFDLDGITEVQRRLFNTLANTYNFFALYTNLDKFVLDEQNLTDVKTRSEFDQWILSALHSLVAEVTDAYENYDVTRAARAIEDFVNDELSNWYIRLSRKRFWKGDLTADKRAAYETLHECLLVTAQLISPVAPFFAEWLYKNLTDPIREQAIANNTPLRFESIHLTSFVKADPNIINKDLEASMKLAQKACSLVHSVRKLQNIRVRQPLGKLYINVTDETLAKQLKNVEALILEETNIKTIISFDANEGSSLFTKSLLPDLKRLGKAMGPKINEVKNILANLSQADIATLEKSGLTITFADGSNATITKEDVIIKTADAVGLASASDGNITVALDTTISDELKQEGIARDLVNRIQNLRKELGLEVLDKIKVNIQKKDAFIDAALLSNQEYICREVQAIDFQLSESVSDAKTVEMEDFELSLSIGV
ncbi:MAG: Isoleucyl-tRNA synthetase [Bacteroidota bacterium]|jgi:isoleucyl-tRNA synthetase